jgi:hypothetical protein
MIVLFNREEDGLLGSSQLVSYLAAQAARVAGKEVGVAFRLESTGEILRGVTCLS